MQRGPVIWIGGSISFKAFARALLAGQSHLKLNRLRQTLLCQRCLTRCLTAILQLIDDALENIIVMQSLWKDQITGSFIEAHSKYVMHSCRKDNGDNGCAERRNWTLYSTFLRRCFLQPVIGHSWRLQDWVIAIAEHAVRSIMRRFERPSSAFGWIVVWKWQNTLLKARNNSDQFLTFRNFSRTSD